MVLLDPISIVPSQTLQQFVFELSGMMCGRLIHLKIRCSCVMNHLELGALHDSACGQGCKEVYFSMLMRHLSASTQLALCDGVQTLRVHDFGRVPHHFHDSIIRISNLQFSYCFDISSRKSRMCIVFDSCLFWLEIANVPSTL